MVILFEEVLKGWFKETLKYGVGGKGVIAQCHRHILKMPDDGTQLPKYQALDEMQAHL